MSSLPTNLRASRRAFRLDKASPAQTVNTITNLLLLLLLLGAQTRTDGDTSTATPPPPPSSSEMWMRFISVDNREQWGQTPRQRPALQGLSVYTSTKRARNVRNGSSYRSGLRGCSEERRALIHTRTKEKSTISGASSASSPLLLPVSKIMR